MDPTNILIFRIGHLGDTVVALPALWALRQRFPASRITLLTNIDLQNPSYVSPASILPPQGLVDEFMAYPTNMSSTAKAGAILRLAKDVRSLRFDAAIYLMPRLRTASQIKRDRAFFRLCGISELEGSEFLLNNRLDVPSSHTGSGTVSEANFLLDMLIDLGIAFGPVKTDLLLTAEEIESADQWMRNSSGISSRSMKIAIAPGAKWESKRWLEENYVEVVSKLLGEHDVLPIVFGGLEDRPRGDRMLHHWGKGANAAGVLSVRESAVVLGRCKLYLGNDTGTMHLASAVGTPCVAIFASLDWRGRWDPFGEQNKLFRSNFECKGCNLGNCVNQNRCLEMISADEVYLACAEMINGN